MDEAVIERFSRHLTYGRRAIHSRPQRVALRHGAAQFLDHLRKRGLNATRARPTEPALLSRFCQWMQQQRGTCASTLTLYRRPILDWLESRGEDPARFDAQSLRQFVLQRRQRGPVAVQTCISALCAFCHFLSAEGLCSGDLVASIPKFARWRWSALPRHLSPQDVERTITSRATDTPLGRRERAILLLLARLGLRAGDIVQLQLSDIDWETGEILVSGKSRRQSRLPLSQEVGDALAAYIQNDRPRCDAPTVFVRACAPFRPFSSHGAVTHIVDRALRRAAVARPARGAAHLFRHSLAASLLQEGSTLQDIAEVLRHRSPATTQIYAKLDVKALQPLAQPWPGVTSC